jgi:1,4-alpha-glucan branching enzyme
LNQAARELLLAQASDWAFIFKTGTCTPYAFKQTKDHIEYFTRLYEDIKSDRIDEPWLRETENRDNIFPDLDYRVYL